MNFEELQKLDRTSCEIGQYFFYGIGTRKNYRRAFPYLLEGAKMGVAQCQNLIGCCYLDGLGVEADPSAARKWFWRAAKQNHNVAIYNLAVICDRGIGVKPNPRKAFSLYLRAAELGNERAQCNLGTAYLDGMGTVQDLVEGIRWTRKAAMKGDAKAQYNLGMAYWNGRGVRISNRNARIWLGKAARQGHRRAASVLQTFVAVGTRNRGRRATS